MLKSLMRMAAVPGLSVAVMLAANPAAAAPGDAGAVPVVIGAYVSELSGEVMVVNTETRLMTLKQADGSYKVINVPLEVSRIDQIGIGDRVEVSETTTVVIELDKGTGANRLGADSATVVDRAEGRKPAGVITDELIFFGEVAAVDTKAATVTIRGADDVQTFTVEDAALLEQFSVGDGVIATIRNRIVGRVTRR